MANTRRPRPVKTIRTELPSTRGITWLAAVALGLVFWGSVIAALWHVATAPKIELPPSMPASAASLPAKPEAPASAPTGPSHADE